LPRFGSKDLDQLVISMYAEEKREFHLQAVDIYCDQIRKEFKKQNNVFKPKNE
jgi:hypothetical protein